MSAVYVIRVDPDGTVTDCEGDDLLAIAGAWFSDRTSDVVSLQTPPGAPPEFPHGDDLLVGVVDDWGRRDGAAVNPKVWALYGRSPIVGVAFVAHDSWEDGGRLELPPRFLSRMREDWVQPPMMHVDAMRSLAAAQGCRWPS